MTDDELVKLMLDLAREKTVEIATFAHGERNAAFVAYSMGAQWALELAALSPEVARRLAEAIHNDQPDAFREWNTNAVEFIRAAASR